MSTITLKHPSAADKDENRLVLVSNLDDKWLEPKGLVLSDEVLSVYSRTMGPMGLAVYVAYQYLKYRGEEPTAAGISSFLGCHKVTAKRCLYLLHTLGLIEEVVK